VKLVLMSYVGVWGLTHGYLLYPQWLAGFFFDTPEGIEAMTATLHTAFVALQMFALSGILIAVLQGAGFTRAVFAIELTTVTLYIAVAYMLTMVWPQTIDVIWRADWVYFGGMICGGLMGLGRLNWREGHPSLASQA